MREFGRTVAHHAAVPEIIPGTGLMPAELIHSLDERATRLAELNHAGLEVVERALDKAVLLLVVRQ